MKKGFTLIELLAVIIILAIIALIAVPIILNVVDDAYISSGKSEAQMIYNGINNYCASVEMKKELGTLTNEDIDCANARSFSDDEIRKMVNLGNAEVINNSYYDNTIINIEIKSNNHIFKLCGNKFIMDDEVCEEVTPNYLIDELLEQYHSDNTTGLVKDTTNENLYYYTGTNEEVANNFLWYGGHLWRILEFDTSSNTLTLITQQPLTSIQPSSTVWTSEDTYNSSYINTWLNKYFWYSLDISVQNNILDNMFNVGIYTDMNEITTTKKVGLLDQTQYERAGSEGSFLDIKNYFWLGNRHDSSYIRYVNSDGEISYNSLSRAYGIRATIKISDIIITDGDGTIKNSYNAIDEIENINNIQVGEYINVPYSGSDNACGSDDKCTFRVVNKTADGIKVVLNGLLPTESEYGNSTTINLNHTIYSSLNTFIAGISDKYSSKENKIFYIGDYPYTSGTGHDYKDVQDETLEANIGLPIVGEMFSSNDINMGSTKIFVDVDTIENPDASINYWTMNRRSSSNVRFISSDGDLDSDAASSVFGIRPVIYLKTENLNLTGGKGTAQMPYELE